MEKISRKKGKFLRGEKGEIIKKGRNHIREGRKGDIMRNQGREGEIRGKKKVKINEDV